MRIFLFLSFATVVAACTKINPDVCCTSETDCSGLGVPNGTGCTTGLVCRGHQCIAETCSASTDCDAAAPYCDGQTCIESCTADIQCPGLGGNADEAFCVAGACVTCREDHNDCPSSAPVCDAGACRICKLDNDCASQVCNVDSGTCADSSTILYVANGGSETSTCVQLAPCSVSRAFSLISANPITMRFADGTYPGGLAFPVPSIVTVVGPGAVISGVATADQQITIGFNTTVTLRGLTISDGDRRPFFCSASSGQSTLNLVDVTALSTGYGGLSNCTANIKRSKILGNIETDGTSSLNVTQSVLAGIATQFSISSTLNVENSTLHSITHSGSRPLNGHISFSTIEVANYIDCYSNLAFDNDIIIQSGGVQGASAYTVAHNNGACTATFDHNLVWPQDATVGTNMIIMDPKVVDALGYDVHLTAASPAIDAANPAETLAIDLDGTSRPQGSGRDLGAYEFH